MKDVLRAAICKYVTNAFMLGDKRIKHSLRQTVFNQSSLGCDGFLMCFSLPFSLVWVVQSLNSPFFPPHIGAEPWRAKEESRITCMRMLRTPPFFPPKSGEKPYLEVFLGGAIFWMIIYKQQFLHSDWLKTCKLIPNQWSFTGATLNHIPIVFLITISKITKEIFAEICWQLKTPTRT